LLSLLGQSPWAPKVTKWFCWSARYEIRAARSVDCVFVPPNLYDVTAIGSGRNHRIQKITVGLFSFYLLQRWVAGLVSLSSRARRRVDSVIADSFRYVEMLVDSLAAARSPTRWLEAACRAFNSQRDLTCGLRETSPFSD